MTQIRHLFAMRLFVCLFALLGSIGAWAETVEIGLGGSADSDKNLPGYNYYNYSYSQQIYTAAEIGVSGPITSIAFKNVGAEKTRTYNVYMALTEKETFTSKTDWVPMSDANLVFSGELTFGVDEWTVIELNTPFSYDGTSNLLVSVADVTGSYSNSPHMSCRVFNATSQAISTSTDSKAFDIANPGEGTLKNVKNQIRLNVNNGISCDRPTDLYVNYQGGTTAEVSWTSPESHFDLDVNGTLIENVSNPYTITGIELSTTYNVKVRAKNSEETSSWSNVFSFTTPACLNGHFIEYTLTDSFGDGWNGASIQVSNGLDIITLTVSTGKTQSGTLNLCNNNYEFIWNKGSYDSECSFVFTENGQTLFEKPSELTQGLVLYSYSQLPKPTALTAGTPEVNSVELSWTENGEATAWQICVNGDRDNLIDVTENHYTLTGLTQETDYSVSVRSYVDDSTCSLWSDAVTFTTQTLWLKPKNLSETNIFSNSAMLSWESESDSYVLQYRTAGRSMNTSAWHQVGSDVVATGTFTPYTFDLSSFTGTGSIAIRHYNVTDMFKLVVDDIVVTNADGVEVLSEDFENNSILNTWTNLDYDGDGYSWDVVSYAFDDHNGSHSVTSESYINNQGPLTPDNWLIIPNVELGGKLTLYARGWDADFPSENFGVFVATESYESVPAGEWSPEITTSENSYQLSGLLSDTQYDWRVKGVYGEGESVWNTSSFSTIPANFKTFITDGNWDVAENWFPTGVPVETDEVKIQAQATIPAGLVAKVKRAILGTDGSIVIKDGGQLKQGAATLRVTMEKEISGYGEGNGHYHFISSPFSGSTLFYVYNTWSCVDNLTDGVFDLYGFRSNEELEWINYKANNTHEAFNINDNSCLKYYDGYLYANQADMTLQFVGTTPSSLNNSYTQAVTFESSSSAFDDWKLVGNPYTCNGTISFVDANDALLDATFYKMNEEGNGYVVCGNPVVLAPGEAAFINFSQSGMIKYSSEEESPNTASVIASAPSLPIHGLIKNQFAMQPIISLNDDGTDNSTILEKYDGVMAHVKLADRTLYKDGAWNTLCLPFDLPLADSPLAGATARTLISASINGTTLNLTFGNPVSTLIAGTPYIIKWDGDGSGNLANPIFSYVLLSNADNSFDTEKVDIITDARVQFLGTYVAQTFGEEDQSILLMGGNNSLYYPQNGARIGAQRAYFKLGDGANIRSFNLTFGEETPTAIVSIEDGELKMSDGWYDLNGRKLNGIPTVKGVYINNGHKVVVK